MTPTSEQHETGVVTAFIVRPRRTRCLAFLKNPKRRRDITRELAHFKWIDPRIVRAIPPEKSSPVGIASILRQKGAPESCWLISEDADMDGREFPLTDALKRIVGYGMGTIVSCIPGKLGYFEDEDGRCILEKP